MKRIFSSGNACASNLSQSQNKRVTNLGVGLALRQGPGPGRVVRADERHLPVLAVVDGESLVRALTLAATRRLDLADPLGEKIQICSCPCSETIWKLKTTCVKICGKFPCGCKSSNTIKTKPCLT